MTIVRTALSGCGVRIDAIETFSDVLGGDIAKAVAKFAENPSRWPWAPRTVGSYLADFTRAFPIIVATIPPDCREALRTGGLQELASPAIWGAMEMAVLNHPGIPGKRASSLSVIQLLNAIHCDQPDLLPPRWLRMRLNLSTLAPLYQVSIPFLLRYAELVKVYDQPPQTPAAAGRFKYITMRLLDALAADAEARALLAVEGFDAFAAHPSLFEKMEASKAWRSLSPIYSLLALHDPIRWEKKVLTVFGYSANLQRLHDISVALYQDVARYVEVIERHPPPGRVKKSTIRDGLSGVQRAIEVVLPTLTAEDSAALIKRGFVVMTEGRCRLLSSIYQDARFDADTVRYLKEVIDTLYPEAKKDKRELIPCQLAFENEFSPRPTYCDYAPIYEMSVRLYEDFAALLANQKADIAAKPYNATTLYHNYTQIKAVLVLLRDNLGDEAFFMDLRRHGLSAFNQVGGRMQKVVLAYLQDAWHEGTIKTLTAKTYRSSVIWFMTECGYVAIDAYPIKTGRTEKHLRRLNTDDYYSAEQCRELAYHIEAMLADGGIAGDQRLALMLARILLKTGWNLAPTLGIQCEDIIRVPTPLNLNGMVAVVLQKARASYRSDAYTFDDPATTNVSAMRSAVTDLLHVRDELTAELRRSLPDSNQYKPYIFLVDKKGVLQRLSRDAVKTVTAMLHSRGCALTFDSMKIRKGGMNHLYRQVQKNMCDYEASAKHDFKTFESHYYRIDENQARHTLGKAVDVMGRYFTGKEISSEIVIVTDPGIVLQRTPVGECASAGDDAEAERYRLEHKRLLAERKSSVRFCADFLSCIWCKFFRLVADPEHVWKLLSYREFVLRSMEFSVVEPDATEDQQTNIDILKRRVTEMLKRLDAISPGVASAGQALLAERGIHPDWTFALIDVPTSANGEA